MAPKNDSKSQSIEIEGVRVSHPDRVLFPGQGVTKRRLIDYYRDVADRMLPHIARRPLSLVRCPSGEGEDCFFQKHATSGFPDALRPVRITEKSGTADYLYIEDEAGLVAAVQMGVLELHIWGAHVDALEMPDRLVFDLDPDEAVDFSRVLEAARELRQRLQADGLESFAMATGGKGIHVVVPLQPRADWDALKSFAERTARDLAADQPDRYLAKAAKSERRGRIFIDYLRNARGATAIAPYSTRARRGAPLAWPISWSSLSRLSDARPASVDTARRQIAALKDDPWPDYFDLDQQLPSE